MSSICSSSIALLLKCYKTTMEILERIKSETEYDHKELESLDLRDYKDRPVWFDGKIEIGYNNDPEAIAHELGHGLHEKVREMGKQDYLGEEFAEAIRYYVETELSGNSCWLNNFRAVENPFTSRFSNLGVFINKLSNESLFQELNWQ